MDKIDINEIIKAAAGALDLSNFKGDVVMFKHVDKEMNVAEGGIGEQHIHHHYANDKVVGGNGGTNKSSLDTEKPICVALNSSQRQILEAAEQNGIIIYNRVREGYDTGHQSSNALVAYLCGRLFCGDSTNREGRWVSGSKFDDAKYCKELFGFDVAGTRRSTQGNGAGKSPIGYERVDKLFE